MFVFWLHSKRKTEMNKSVVECNGKKVECHLLFGQHWLHVLAVAN